MVETLLDIEAEINIQDNEKNLAFTWLCTHLILV